MKLEEGDRVRVLPNWNWPRTCVGRVARPPELADTVVEDGPSGWLGCRRVVEGRKGPIEFHWVIFDEPQLDGDDDGPYSGGEVETEYLTRLAEAE
jgi:hypothetical protein